ncbi:Protein of uncharacterised function DUF111 [Corynebacterium renale]|nr:Protein of uncharacterised function DUF111 [Corynebacterium renale]
MIAQSSMWIDATAGVAGDMLLGALLDLDAGASAVQKAWDAVLPGALKLQVTRVQRAGQASTHAVPVLQEEDSPHRHLSDICALLDAADLDPWTRTQARAVFELLADAEAHVHGTGRNTVHFHEVGALDSIADVVGVCEALRLLGAPDVHVSPIALGAGRVQAAHGYIPVPVPAVMRLMDGWPAAPNPGPSPGELATPTGVALLRHFAVGAPCESPVGVIGAVGVGAGTRDPHGWPNVVRAVQLTGAGEDALVQLEANVDDMDPRLWPGVLNALLGAGARDAWLTPIQMKKGRPAHTVHTLVEAGHADAVRDVFFTHTTTFGVRAHAVTRSVAERHWEEVQVRGQTVRIKVATWNGREMTRQPEYEDIRAAAAALGVPEREVVDAIGR